MAITSKEKELTAIGISVAAGCKPCTDFHIKKAFETDATKAEIKQAIRDALIVRRSAADIMEDYGLSHLGESNSTKNSGNANITDRVHELVSIGAAYSVNCVSNLKSHLNAAEKAGISHQEIMMIVKLSAFIKEKAASHVEHLVHDLKRPEAVYEEEVGACCRVAEEKVISSHSDDTGGKAQMMSQMMKECCGEDGQPNFEKMMRFMEKRGKMEFTKDKINMMHDFCSRTDKPNAEKI